MRWMRGYTSLRELVDTGYLHNHTRMWFASIWIFTLGLPWQLGADFFYRHLLDGDAASNTLSWRWVAGLQTAGKTYLATASNISRYTEGRFSPSGLATSARALVEEPLPSRASIAPAEPTPSGARVGLLLHEEDLEAASLRAENSWFDSDSRLVAIAGSADPDERSPSGASDAVRRFTASALDDAAIRALDSSMTPPFGRWTLSGDRRECCPTHFPLRFCSGPNPSVSMRWLCRTLRLARCRNGC